jgi:D-glutamate cyclase
MASGSDRDTGSLARLGRSIERFIQQDPGGRGLSTWATTGTLFPAALSLAGGRHVLMVTGFYVAGAGAIETDGPPGAIVMAHVLQKIGKKVTIVTDRHAEEILRAGLGAMDVSADVVLFSAGERIEFDEVARHDTTHMVAIERPGRSADGVHRNFRGIVISDNVAPLDDLFLECAGEGIVTIGIGDGGNELGMGNVGAAVGSFCAANGACCCPISSDLCICAGVSNWGGYALAALLSVLAGKVLLPEPPELSRLVDAIVAAGAVDGISGLPARTVDGLPWQSEEDVYDRLSRIAGRASSLAESGPARAAEMAER